MTDSLAVFEGRNIRRHYDEKTETWYFSVVDIIQVLIQQPDFQAARNYWKVLKNRLNKEGSQPVTKCNRLKMVAEDGKMRFTDVASPETLLRLIQSVPSPKAEPIKLWLAKVGYERMQELADPARSLDRARETWRKHGRVHFVHNVHSVHFQTFRTLHTFPTFSVKRAIESGSIRAKPISRQAYVFDKRNLSVIAIKKMEKT